MKFLRFTIFFTCLMSFAVASPISPVIGHRSSVIEITVNRQPSTINRLLPAANRQPPTNLDRAAFYRAIQSENKSLVDAQIAELNSAPADVSRDAFLGAMMMRRAGFGGSAPAKLKFFKQGRRLLEGAIAGDPNNAEYRFLRLMIQENAPPALGYNKEEKNDSEMIRKSYKSLPEELQKTMADYNKKSKNLKLQVS